MLYIIAGIYPPNSNQFEFKALAATKNVKDMQRKFIRFIISGLFFYFFYLLSKLFQ